MLSHPFSDVWGTPVNANNPSMQCGPCLSYVIVSPLLDIKLRLAQFYLHSDGWTLENVRRPEELRGHRDGRQAGADTPTSVKRCIDIIGIVVHLISHHTIRQCKKYRDTTKAKNQYETSFILVEDRLYSSGNRCFTRIKYKIVNISLNNDNREVTCPSCFSTFIVLVL